MAYTNYYARRVAAPFSIHRPVFAPAQRHSAHNYRPNLAPFARQPFARAWYGAGHAVSRYAPGYAARYASRFAPGYAARITPGYASRYTNRFAPGYAARYTAGTRWNWMRRLGTGYGYLPRPYGNVYSQQGVADQAQPQSAPDQAQQPQGAPPPMPPQWVAWAQSCLAQTVGSWVPQNGIMARATRHAIRTFQQQQQLPATGMLDAATINALQAACSPQPAASPAPPPAPVQAAPPAPAPAGDDVAAATAAASASSPAAPPPDAAPAADPSGAAPPDAPAGEFFMGQARGWRGPRRWGSGFSFVPSSQPDPNDEDSEMYMGNGRGRFHRHWGSGMGYQQQQDDSDSGSYPPPPPRHRWQM